jgi:hypothetical protein
MMARYQDREDAPIIEGFEYRDVVGLPRGYMVQAPGVLFAAQKMLWHAGCVSGKRCPTGWDKAEPGFYHKWQGNYLLMVSRFGDRQWAVERIDFTNNERQALTFAFQYVPVWGRTRREAMFLAEFYTRPFGLQLVGCCWADVTGIY